MNNENLFRTADRAQALVDILTKKKLNEAGYSIKDFDSISSNTKTEVIAERIFDKSGQKVNINDYITKINISVNETKDYSVDVFKVFEELSTKIKERQKAVKLFYSSIKNYSQYKSLDDDKKVGNNLLSDSGNYNNTYIPEVFEHMIEDENYDDLGPGSGKRYIIRRPQIKSMNFSEKNPTNTYVEVHGTLNSYLSDQGKLPGKLANFPLNGNAMTSAGAIDYDMWRNYGFKGSSPINAPFLRDPVTQCAPFASMILSRARKEVLTGSVTISGNEYMQPGEVVFIEDRGLLFYVNSVKHQFAFGSGFSTTLELTYGHAPGEYIPTTLDVMGKMLYNNRDLCNVCIQRQTSALNENSLGIIVLDPNAPPDSSNSKYQSQYNDNNLRTINNILYSTQQFINKNTIGGKSTKKTRVELRIYHDNQNSVDPMLNIFLQTVRDTIEGKNDSSTKASYDPSLKANVSFINKESLVSNTINMNDEDEPRAPSQKAINMARDLVASQSSSTSDSDSKKRNQLRSKIFKYIIDCWIVYEDVLTTEES
jgi:small nuclear ribonucleoprotein (snRNP)-like protein